MCVRVVVPRTAYRADIPIMSKSAVDLPFPTFDSAKVGSNIYKGKVIFRFLRLQKPLETNRNL